MSMMRLSQRRWITAKTDESTLPTRVETMVKQAAVMLMVN